VWGPVPSAGQIDYLSLAIAPDGNPLVAFMDFGNGGKATVMKYNGSAWGAMGNVGFSADAAMYTTLALTPNGVPVVAYRDSGNNDKATVMTLISGKTATTTALSSNRNPSSSGQSVTFTATVTPSGATGTVTFKDGTTDLGTGSLSGGTAVFSTSTLSIGNHSITAVYSGDSGYSGSTSSVLTQTVRANVNITVATVPAGQSFTVDTDSTVYTAPHTFSWAPESSHALTTTSPQTVGGTRYVFARWEDNSTPMSRTITVPATDTTYTATFTTQYQLTTAVSPAGNGYVTPASGSWYPAGTVVSVKATPNKDYTFTSWSGPVANNGSAATTVTMTGPTTVTANLTGTPLLTATITAKSGLVNARDWTISFANSGQGTAITGQITGLTLKQTYGTACIPVITTPTSFPLAVGSIPVGGSAAGHVIIDFTGCVATARFSATITYGAANGSTGTMTFSNQYR
jgi:hypothetical protein